ncbi:divergent PAP2 family protein [Paenibacillus segetis]|uniref:Membrane protein YuiD n=1 Tax=Paenibacillus segetis TaxID=1325360 RepID=A0ABQ1YBE2_9BACL|nr:divergent PAP2 family protein [Paenibacillus segetis]GGH19774.1 putative membrane protein YuiD [Paenibacillus segetis]
MHTLFNFPLASALLSMIVAQVIKLPLQLISKKSWNPAICFSTGGMPSSHSATVASLATAVGIMEGFNSSVFAVAAVVCAITMYDAAGIRRNAGLHASLLNRLVKQTPALLKDAPPTDLKELLGHRPVEVLAGALLGIGISLLIHFTVS